MSKPYKQGNLTTSPLSCCVPHLSLYYLLDHPWWWRGSPSKIFMDCFFHCVSTPDLPFLTHSLLTKAALPQPLILRAAKVPLLASLRSLELMVAFRNSCANGRCSHWISCIHGSGEVFAFKMNLTTRKVPSVFTDCWSSWLMIQNSASFGLIFS